MKTIRYILHPGKVISKTDGDVHFIGARQLAYLYGVRLEDFNVIVWTRERAFGFRDQPSDVHLYPRYDGNYQKVSEKRLPYV